MTKKIKLAVIFGGPSGEHKISLKSAKEVISFLDKDKYEILSILVPRNGEWKEKLLIQCGKIDLAIIIGHGTFMEDGHLQAILETYQIPYLFSGVLASVLAMNKHKSKIMAESVGIRIAKSITVRKEDIIYYQKIRKIIKFPAIIKPNRLGSSIGISVVKNKKEFHAGAREAFKWDREILLEEFIQGRELTVAVVEMDKLDALPVVEIKPQVSKWFNYDAKYKKGGSLEICPAEIPSKIAKKAQNYAKKIFRVIDCRDLARVDFIWDDKNDKVYFLEINNIPGMTERSIVPLAARSAGHKLEKIFDVFIKRRLGKV
jgi:D-alanine-D-alanine ligase